jgi:FkbM family methyltransferase
MSWWDAMALVSKSRNFGSGEHTVRFRPLNRPVTLRPSKSDLVCYEKIFVAREYDVPFDINPSFIIDAGANVGMSTLRFKQQYPSATIIAIEPEPANCALLERNCGSLPGVHIVKAAVWASQARLSFAAPDSESWSFSVVPAEQPESKPQLVTAVTIEELLNKYGFPRIDLLKLDVEGAEIELFGPGCERWLSRVNILVFELHDRFRLGCSRAVYTALTKFSFHQEIRGENIFIRLFHNA